MNKSTAKFYLYMIGITVSTYVTTRYKFSTIDSFMLGLGTLMGLGLVIMILLIASAFKLERKDE